MKKSTDARGCSKWGERKAAPATHQSASVLSAASSPQGIASGRWLIPGRLDGAPPPIPSLTGQNRNEEAEPAGGHGDMVAVGNWWPYRILSSFLFLFFLFYFWFFTCLFFLSFSFSFSLSSSSSFSPSLSFAFILLFFIYLYRFIFVSIRNGLAQREREWKAVREEPIKGHFIKYNPHISLYK